MFEKKAQENLKIPTGGVTSANLPKSIEKIDTRKELSKLAGVGERTYGKAAAILSSNNDEVKLLRSGHYPIKMLISFQSCFAQWGNNHFFSYPTEHQNF